MNVSDGTSPNENNPNLSRSNNQRKGKGRKKLSMEKIENEKNLQVTFSKRRAGIFKKASELNTLCGAESAILIFSPCDRAHTYGHPNVETIANRFLNTNVEPTPPANSLLAALNEAGNLQLNQELVHMEGLLEHERQRKMELDQMFQVNINNMNYEELNQLHESLLGFKSIFQSRFKDASSLGGVTNIQGSPEEGGLGPSVGFTNPGESGMASYINVDDSTHWTDNSSITYLAPLNKITKFMLQHPYEADDSGSSGKSTNIQEPNPKPGGLYNPCIGFTNPSGIDMTGYINASDPIHWAHDSLSSYRAPFNPNIGYMVIPPFGAGGSNAFIPHNFIHQSGETPLGNTTVATSDMGENNGTHVNVSNMSRGRVSRHNNGCGGRS